MAGQLCVHGHFYQPPREDPWLGCILPEGTAAPAMDWNSRILRESYAPLAFARRLDAQGRITDIVNCYEWISFNFGPTLLSWLERGAPRLYARLLEADRRSQERWGHGNAMAQVYHHAILPLASARDRMLEIAWALDDFESRFGRRAEGMWLSEAAVDTPTLESMSAQGVRFTILSPHQVQAIAGEDGTWQPVSGDEVDLSRPYSVDLPSERPMAVFFYNGPLSQAVAFEGLLKDGERFWNRLTGVGSEGLLSIGTDGETYGHHFPFGEMALAYVLEQARAGRQGWSLTNYAAYLADNPPKQRVRLKEPSSWSCSHGVERWRADCGCRDGGHPQWNQKWRAPLRQGLEAVKQKVDEHFDALGKELFLVPDEALRAYGTFLSGKSDSKVFQNSYMKSGLSRENIQKSWKLLEMQRFGLAMFASCAWFFDDVSRVEPRNALTYCMRAMECCRASGGPDLESVLCDELKKIYPNEPRYPDGMALYEEEVVARRQTTARLTCLALVRLRSNAEMPPPGGEAEVRWPGVHITVARSLAGTLESGTVEGTALLRMCHGGLVAGGAVRCGWRWEQGRKDDGLCGQMYFQLDNGTEETIRPESLHWKMRQSALQEAVELAASEDWEALWRHAEQAKFFLEYRPYQSVPQHQAFWAAQWPALALAVIRQPCFEDRKDLWNFIRSIGEGHPAKPWLEQRLGRSLRDMLCEGTVQSAELAEIIRRSRAAGLEVDLWGLQNRFWHDAELWSDAALGKALGIAPGARG